LALNAWRIEPGASHRMPGARELRLLFVTEGCGTIGSEELRRWSALRLRPGESAELRAVDRLELLELAIQTISDLRACGAGPEPRA
jgi:hypothetical protein